MNGSALIAVLSALAAAILAVVGAFALWARLLMKVEETSRQCMEEGIRDLHTLVADLARSVDDLPRRWDDIRSETRRLRDRAIYHHRRVSDELEEAGYEDPEITSIGKELGVLDPASEVGDQIELLPDETPLPDAQPVDPEDWRALGRQRKYGGRR